MVKPAFSEFSYGFALTHELCNTHFGGMRAAPVFPSLIEEGKDGVGYDVHLAKPGAPLFVQFKISQYMVMASAGQWHLFGQPYYRFWLHATGRSSQHRALLKRDKSPNLVLYAAPAVHEIDDLNYAFHNGNVVATSVFFRPRDIGPQSDAKEHCVAFLPGAGMGYFCSEPRRVEQLATGRGVFEALAESFRQVERVAPTAEYFDRLADDLEREFGADTEVATARFRETQSTLLRARQRAAYGVRTILGAELLWVASTDSA
jgi:hypothetical protein